MDNKLDQDLMLAKELPTQSIALILAGGRGSRLKDLTSKRAKPAVHFGGKFRIIDFPLSNCINSGIRRIGVLTQYQSHSLIQHIQRGWSFFNEEMNEFIDLLPAQQQVENSNWYVSTGDAVYQNLDIILRYRANFIVILAGDHIYKMDYSKMLLDHVKKAAKCSVGCIKVPLKNAKGLGVMTIDQSEKIIEFNEKPENPTSLPDDPNHCLASMGIYIFNTDYLVKMLEEDHEDPNSTHDFGHDIIPKGVKQGVVYAHPFNRSCVTSDHSAPPYWRDVGTVDAYWRANLDLASVMPELDIYDPYWPIRTYVDPLPPAKFVQNLDGGQGMTMNSLIGAGSIISGSMIVNSIIFSKVRIDSFCTIDSSIISPDCIIKLRCRLRRCIIDRACYIPEGMIIGENPEEDAKRFYRSESGITLVTREMLRKLGIAQP
ncbi:glucose-1-phosphate adenylyltransferase [Gilliamella sp. wkB178]|uniref:glucose-1-phosphate adenylyltransferase n=1 Tax=Gilliamella sp. wkB178 TaxID=3120259 RepID=UPI00080EC9ED|nr:glucose-1-phosphate adenylyltransferase [Gilliamella apicola]OCG07803.1 glucose-1-phosphate adenylyltransferase [Gilliamella apicola]